MSTVTIGCKFPNGIRLEIGKPGEAGYESVICMGANQGSMHGSTGIFMPSTVGGFGRTVVSAAFWERWSTGADLQGVEIKERDRTISAEENTRSLIKARRELVDEWQAKGVLFVVKNPDIAVAAANEKANVVTGFEPLRPEGDTRTKGAAPGVSKMQ